jgi:hypothetical protein
LWSSRLWKKMTIASPQVKQVCLSLSSEGQCCGVIGSWESWRSAFDVRCRLKLSLDTPAKKEVVLHLTFIIFCNLYLHLQRTKLCYILHLLFSAVYVYINFCLVLAVLLLLRI